MRFLALLAALVGCSQIPPYCKDRADDVDCDGIPDANDRCADSPLESPTDRLGCTENQAAGCSVSLVRPDDRENVKGEVAFRWTGDCDTYLLQFAEDPAFPAAATRTAIRTEAREVMATGSERYWRVVGGRTGSSAGFSTPARRIKW